MSDQKKVVAVPLDKLEELLRDLQPPNAEDVKGGAALQNLNLSVNPQPQFNSSLLAKLRVAASSWRVVL